MSEWQPIETAPKPLPRDNPWWMASHVRFGTCLASWCSDPEGLLFIRPCRYFTREEENEGYNSRGFYRWRRGARAGALSTVEDEITAWQPVPEPDTNSLKCDRSNTMPVTIDSESHDEMRRQLAQCESDREMMAAENARLRAALKPFVDIAPLVSHTKRRDGERVFELPKPDGGYWVLVRDDFRRAAAAMTIASLKLKRDQGAEK